MCAEIRQSFLVVPVEITFDDCRHGIVEYGLRPILGQAAAFGPANVPPFSSGRIRKREASVAKSEPVVLHHGREEDAAGSDEVRPSASTALQVVGPRHQRREACGRVLRGSVRLSA